MHQHLGIVFSWVAGGGGTDDFSADDFNYMEAKFCLNVRFIVLSRVNALDGQG